MEGVGGLWGLGMTPWLVGLALACLLLFAARRLSPSLDQACENLLSGLSPRPEGGAAERTWAWGGFLFLLAAFAGLEALQPYYFTQDDVLVTELPGILLGCRELWSGHFPDFNPYTLMGTPLASFGGASLTYSPTYLAYAISRHLLGNEYALMEVFALLHLAAGYWIMRNLARRLGMGSVASTLATLSFLLSGSILIMGRSWHMTLPMVVWVPLLLLSVMNLKEGKGGVGWALWTGSAIGIYYHVGFSQVWAFALLFWGLAILLFVPAGGIPVRRAMWALPAFLFGLAISLPLLWTQVVATRDMVKAAGYGNGIQWGLPSLFLPYPIKALHPNAWGSTDLRYMGHFYYFGTLFMVLYLVALLALLTSKPKRRVMLSGAVWTLCGATALWMTLGNQGGLWKLFSYVPILKQVNNHPFRLLPFFVLFAVLAGGQVLEHLLRALPKRRLAGAVLGALAVGLLAYHVAMARPSFYTYGFKPYPLLPREMSQLFRAGGEIPEGRILPIAPARSILPDYPLSLALSLPAAYGMASVEGYDPLTQSRPPIRNAMALIYDHPAEALRAYGVRWLVVHRSARSPVFSPNPLLKGLEGNAHSAFLLSQLESLHAEKVIDRPEVEVWALPQADPMAFPLGSPSQSLALSLTGSGVVVDTSTLPAGGIVVINFLWYPNVRASVQGRELPSGRDRWGRVVVQVPPDTKAVRVRLGAAWARGLLNGGLLLFLSLLTMALLTRRERVATGLQRVGAG
jgi:hypothetical protein